jgi:RNA recognition motif-containing protein
MEDVGYNFNSRQNSRLQMSKDRSRSRSPREWKQSERRVSEYTNDSDVKVRLFVSNLPYDLRWQDLKDIFREKVGSEVRRAELLTEPDGRPSEWLR